MLRGCARLTGASLVVLVFGCPADPPSLEGITGATGSSSSTGRADVTSEPATGEGSDSSGGPAPDPPPDIDSECGDGIVEGLEECDLGPGNGGGSYCRDNCVANRCPDGYLGPGEQCDDGNVDDSDACTNGCGPPTCGDGILDEGEQCDDGRENGPTAPCLLSCMLASCGDGMVLEGTEACDATEVGTESCVGMGYDGGVLLCGPDCMGLDTSNCYVCGNDLVEPGEECDGSVGRTVCADLTPDLAGGPWDGGTVDCGMDCRFDESQCCHGTPGEGCTTDAQCCGDMLQCADQACCIADGGSCAGMTMLCCSGTCDADTTTCVAP